MKNIERPHFFNHGRYEASNHGLIFEVEVLWTNIPTLLNDLLRYFLGIRFVNIGEDDACTF